MVETPPTIEYPVQLGLAYLLMVGYLVRTLFVSFRLPASVGVIFSGFAFSYFFQSDIFFARDVLQGLAFFLVLLTAGLEISLQDLKPYIFVMAWLPATFELLGIAAYGALVLNYTMVESLVLGTVLVALGDGLVIPKMKEFGALFKGHPMPRLVFTWAPLEASFALTLFGVLVGLSAPANQPDIDLGVLVFANILRIAATLCMGAVLGAGSGWLIPRRTQLAFRGQQVFTGASVEAFLMILAVALSAFGMGAGEAGKELVPMGFSPGSLFQSELLVIVTGTFFAAVAHQDVLDDVEGILGGVWVFGQLVLFSMLGSRTTPGIFPEVPHVLPIIAIGLTFRMLGVLSSIGLILMLNLSGHPFDWNILIPDALFCFLSTLPRATIQGALGSVPVTQRFFQHCPQKHVAQAFIFTAARLYIVCMSVCGMILLNYLGPQLLAATSNRPQWDDGRGGDCADNEGVHDDLERTLTFDVATALEILADEYTMAPSLVSETLMKAAGRLGAQESLDDSLELPIRMVSEPAPHSKIRQNKFRGRGHFGRLLGIHAPTDMAHRSRDLALSQFDCMGSLFSNEVSVLHHKDSVWRGGTPVNSRPGSPYSCAGPMGSKCFSAGSPGKPL